MDSRDFHLLKPNQESYKYFVNHWYESISSFYFQMRILIVLLLVMVFLSRAQELSKSIGLYASTGEWSVWNRSDRTVLQVRFFKTSSTIVFLLFLSAFMALWIFPSNPASIDIIIILIGIVNVFACEWFSKNEIWIFGICLATPRKRNILKINDKVFSF